MIRLKKLGKEDSHNANNPDYLVWCLGEEGQVGEPYYMLHFNYGNLDEIQIGICC